MTNSLEQVRIFAVFFLTGIAVGVLFDCFRISRRVVKTSDFITALEDGLFWILTGLLLLYMIFVFHYGQIRLYLILGAISRISSLLFYHQSIFYEMFYKDYRKNDKIYHLSNKEDICFSFKTFQKLLWFSEEKNHSLLDSY